LNKCQSFNGLKFAPPDSHSESILSQWESGGANFKPLKDWYLYKPASFRKVKDTYRDRKDIAEKVLRYSDIQSFKQAYPDLNGIRKLSKQIREDGKQRN
jgi:hypothetical protein